MARSREATKAIIRSRVKLQRRTGCWLWTGTLDTGGYGVFFWGPNGHKYKGAHRVAYAAFVADPGRLHVCHRCDVPACCNPDHLFLGTPSENHRDKVAKGRANNPRGEANSGAKLTAKHVRRIVRRLDAGDRQGDIARDYGVSAPAISYINTGKTWGHVTGRGKRLGASHGASAPDKQQPGQDRLRRDR